MTDPHDPLIDACQNAWDAGTDPADDPAVQQLLEQDPSLLEAFAAWRARMASVRNAGASTATTRPRWVATAAALVLVAGAGWGVQQLVRSSNNPTVPAPHAPPTHQGYFVSTDFDVKRERIQHRSTSAHRILINQPMASLVITTTRTLQ